MTNENIEKAFDSDLSGNKRNLRVNLINPPVENPWRTRGEYIEERNKLLELQERQIEALKDIKRASWQQTIVFVFTILVAVATISGTYLSFVDSIKNEQKMKKK